MEVEERTTETSSNEEQANNDESNIQSTPNSNNSSDANNKGDIEQVTPSNKEPRYQPKQRIYARDTSNGVYYEAIVRRSLFGVNNNPQVVIGLVSNENEIEDALTQPEEPTWHYFVHYQKWNVNWDRWVSEDDIMENTEESKEKADRYMREHKKLQQEMKMKKGRKMDGTAFLREWRKRMDQIEKELKKEGGNRKKKLANGGATSKEGEEMTTKEEPTADIGATKAEEKSAQPVSKPKFKKAKKSSSADKWDEAAVEKEYELRLQGLEGKRTSQQQHKVPLPFSLKKEMVEAWEFITTCQMVADLPAKMTVRKALDIYLKSKLELIGKKTMASMKGDNSSEKMEEKSNDKETNNGQGKATAAKGMDYEEKREEEAIEKRKKEWTDMVEGIAMFFDEALSFRLLYREELPQYRVVESTFEVADEAAQEKEAEELSSNNDQNEDDNSTKADVGVSSSIRKEGMESNIEHNDEQAATKDKMEVGEDADASASDTADPKSSAKTDGKTTQKMRPMLPSEVYGCEHLLRLCLKIPELLTENKPAVKSTKGDEDGALAQEALKNYEKESKLILAKVNDLVRFLHKHQSTMFIETFRKSNEAEQREEQKWMRYVERKRKRAIQESQEAATDDSGESKEATDTNNAVAEDNPPPAKKPLFVSTEA